MLVSEIICSKKFLNFQENISVKVAGYLTLTGNVFLGKFWNSFHKKHSQMAASTITCFFISNVFFFNSACCLTFSWIELQMLFRCCWIHITIIILKHILHLVCLCPCLGLRLFMSYLCDLFFIFSLIFIAIKYKLKAFDGFKNKQQKSMK